MMRALFSFLIVFLCLPSIVIASQVSFNFQVEITEINSNDSADLIPDIETGLSVGSILQGRITYDLATPEDGAPFIAPDGTALSRYLSAGTIELYGTGIGTFASPSLTATVIDNSPFRGSIRDRVYFQGSEVGPELQSYTLFSLLIEDETRFSNTALPGLLDLRDVSRADFYFGFADANTSQDRCRVGNSYERCGTYVLGSIIEIEPASVPLPPSVLLALGSLLGLGLFRKELGRLT